MKNTKRLLIILAFLANTMVVFSPVVTGAQSSQTDSGFNTPARKMESPTIGSIPESSGFVDDNGKPLSREEYEKIQQKRTGIQWDHILELLAVIGVITGVIFLAIRLKKKNTQIVQPVNYQVPINNPVGTVAPPIQPQNYPQQQMPATPLPVAPEQPPQQPPTGPQL